MPDSHQVAIRATLGVPDQAILMAELYRKLQAFSHFSEGENFLLKNNATHHNHTATASQ
jgi:hypothetical protein